MKSSEDMSVIFILSLVAANRLLFVAPIQGRVRKFLVSWGGGCCQVFDRCLQTKESKKEEGTTRSSSEDTTRTQNTTQVHLELGAPLP